MNNFVTEQVIENAIMKELIYQTDLEGVCTGMIDQGHKALIQELSDVFDQDVSSVNQLKPIEDLYEFFVGLKEEYNLYIEYLDEHNEEITHERIKEIMGGIKTMFMNDLDGFLSLTDNVAVIEYKAQVKSAKEQLAQILNERKGKIQKVVVDGYIEETYVDEAIKQNLIQLFQETIIQVNAFQERHRAGINDLNKRVQLQSYVDFLYKQDKTIAMLNLIQMDVIHQEVSDPHQQEVLENLALRIKEIYQIIAIKVSEITTFLDELEINFIQGMTIENQFQGHIEKVLSHITEDTLYKEAVEYYLDRRNLLVKDLFVSITDEIEKANDVAIKTLNKGSQDIQLISCKISENIKTLDYNLRSLDKYLKEEDEYYNIIKGISDTVSLKLSALREKDYDYMLGKQNKIVKYEKQLFEFLQEIKDRFEEYFHVMLDENKSFFFDKQTNYNKIFEVMEQEAKQVDIDYLKYNLLFEIVTLEEIIHYSLPRLEAFDQPLCQQTITMVRKTYDDIQSLLKKFNISVIDASPGDKFNGKLHEVTVVNESETYHKGQIIGLITKGYIYRNIPVVRAHVIVAK